MKSARSHTMWNGLVISFSAVVVFMATASTASAQATPDLFTRVETLPLSAGTPRDASGSMSIAGDTAVVGGDEVVHVFERESGGDQWVHSATLVASDGRPGFGKAVVTNGATTVVGAGVWPRVGPGDGAAYVFQRIPGSQAWQETARLRGDTNAASFGASVAVSGTTIVVGAPPTGATGPGVVFVFEEDEDGAWGEVARLSGEPFSGSSLTDDFGASVSIDADTVIAGAQTPSAFRTGVETPLVYVFSRGGGGMNTWSLDAILPLRTVSEGGLGSVAISGDTVAAGAFGLFGGFGVYVFQRDRIVPNAWVEIDRKSIPTFEVDIDGDFVVAIRVGSGGETGGVFARHQGGTDGWGEVHPFGDFPTSRQAAISGDTALLLVSPTRIDVYVADTDRDGLRDGIDACPRDPLNNVEGGCTRTSAAYLVLDDLITLGDVATETRGDEFHITATFTNTSDTAIGNPFFEVTDLSGGNLLVNADAGPGGAGATLSPDVGDGILSPGESTTVTFVVGLATHEAFSFFVSVRGDAGP